MKRIVGYSTIAIGSAAALYTYYTRGEPSRPLARLLSAYLTHATALPTTIHSCHLSYSKPTGLLLTAHKVSVCRDDQYRLVCGHDNYSRFDLVVEQVTAKVDLVRWLWERRNAVTRCELAGVRGTVDRTRLKAMPNWRQQYHKKEIDLPLGLTVKDVLVTIQRDHQFSFPFSIYTADIPRLRWSWLLHDLLHSRSIIGSYDNSLFTFQPPQLGDRHSQRQLRVDSLNIDHVRGAGEGPLTWIQRGRLAVDILVTLPVDSCDGKQYGDVWLGNFFKTLRRIKSPNDGESIDFQVDLRLSGVRAQVPLITADLSLYNQALVRPTVAYLNEHRHHTIPLTFSFSVLTDRDLRGAWGLIESGISALLQKGVQESFAELAADKQKAPERMRRVGLWSIYSLFRQIAN